MPGWLLFAYLCYYKNFHHKDRKTALTTLNNNTGTTSFQWGNIWSEFDLNHEPLYLQHGYSLKVIDLLRNTNSRASSWVEQVDLTRLHVVSMQRYRVKIFKDLCSSTAIYSRPLFPIQHPVFALFKKRHSLINNVPFSLPLSTFMLGTSSCSEKFYLHKYTIQFVRSI